MKVPLMDLRANPDPYTLVDYAVADGEFVGGQNVAEFEAQWAAHVGAASCVGVNSGTDALYLTLVAWAKAFPSRTKVLIPATSFVATLEAVLIAGLTPVVVDVDQNGLMAPAPTVNAIEDHLDELLAIVPVHLYGQVLDIPNLWTYPPLILEDACQAHGACYPDGTRVGSRDAAAWSFMPAKILGAWGDAGAVTLPARRPHDESIIRALANHGRLSHNVHHFSGYNSRLDNVQAAVLLHRFRKLAADIRAREQHALAYKDALPAALRTQPHTDGRVWSYFACWAEDVETRDGLLMYLRGRDIAAGMHYPYTLTNCFANQALIAGFAGRVYVPVAEHLARTTLTLPLWPGMHVDQRDYVIEVVRNFYGGAGG